MAEISPQRIKHGWRITHEELTLDAESPRVDQGVVRTTLTVSNHCVIHYRDTANLTSARARARILKTLTAKGVAIPENVLIALDEACRSKPAPQAEQTQQPVGHGGDADFSEKVTHLVDLQKRIAAFLLLKDPG